MARRATRPRYPAGHPKAGQFRSNRSLAAERGYRTRKARQGIDPATGRFRTTRQQRRAFREREEEVIRRRTTRVSRSARVGKSIRVEFNKAKRPTRAVLHRPGRKPQVFEGRDVLRQVSLALLPPRSPFDLRRDARENRRIIDRLSGTIVARTERRNATWEDLQGHNLIPPGVPADAVLSARVTFRGFTFLVQAKRDELVSAIIASLPQLTEVERARMFKGPSGRRAAAAVLDASQEDVDELPSDELQDALDAAGVEPSPLTVEVIR